MYHFQVNKFNIVDAAPWQRASPWADVTVEDKTLFVCVFDILKAGRGFVSVSCLDGDLAEVRRKATHFTPVLLAN